MHTRVHLAANDLNWLLVVLRINVDLAIFQPYLDLEAGDNKSLKIQVARPGIEPRSSCSASQELNHSATAAPANELKEYPQRHKYLFTTLLKYTEPQKKRYKVVYCIIL